MKSRMEKYYNEQPQYRRTTKNADLYKEVYKSYSNVETLPIADNTNEIDIEELQRIVRESRNRNKRNIDNIEAEKEIEIRKEDQREYDINKIIEKVKNENRKTTEKPQETLAKRSYLATLKSEELPVSKIKEAYLKQELAEKLEKKDIEDEKIYMTRELKFKDKQLEVTREIEILKQTENSSPLDLFEDLKPSGNTFITEPVKPEKNSIFSNQTDLPKEEDYKPKVEKIKSDYKEDYDIDIIKKQTLNSKKDDDDDDFYTDSYKFSKKDFVDDEDDDFYDKPKKSSGILKIILLLALILALATTIYYFINKYGMGV